MGKKFTIELSEEQLETYGKLKKSLVLEALDLYRIIQDNCNGDVGNLLNLIENLKKLSI